MRLVPSLPDTSLTIEALLRIIAERDAEMELLKLMVDKLTLQLLRARRAQYGRSSEQLDDPQIALIEGAPLYEHPAPKAAPKADAANSVGIDRQLPAHLPRENLVHRPATTEAAHDATGNACGCTACGGRLRQIGADVSEQLEYVPSRFKVIRHVRPKLACVNCEAILWRVNLDARGATIWMRTVSRRVDDAAHLIVAGAIHAGVWLSPDLRALQWRSLRAHALASTSRRLQSADRDPRGPIRARA